MMHLGHRHNRHNHGNEINRSHARNVQDHAWEAEPPVVGFVVDKD